MKKISRILMVVFVLAAVCVFAASGPAQAASFTAGGYSENFDGIGQTGGTSAVLPSGWSMYWKSGNDTTWGTSIPSADIAAMTLSATQTAFAGPWTGPLACEGCLQQSQWFNWGRSGFVSDRYIGTSPSNAAAQGLNAGMGFQLQLTNNSGIAQNQISVSYDTAKFYNGTNVPGNPESLPGYQLWYQIGAGSWINASAFNLTTTELPIGTPGAAEYFNYSITNRLLDFGASWGVGQTLNLRWVDDNAAGLATDQIIALNNVNVQAAPVPIPAAAWLLGSGLLGLVALRRRKK